MPAETPLDLKTTINLPKTEFSQKGNLTHAEPARLERWQSLDLYGKIRAARKGAPLFVLHDGPPYANGDIHVGHVLNKVLKDLIVKTRTMMGMDAPYIPGWDCHGLPIEIQVDKKLGKKKYEMAPIEIRRLAREHAEHFIKSQAADFMRLGVLGTFDDPYKTMSPGYEATTVRVFGKFVQEGSVYKGLRSVHWCLTCETALAEAEIEYSDEVSPSVYVRFPLKDDPARIDETLKGKRVWLVIWTTTPWTLPANMGIAANANFEYSAAEVDGDVYIVASELLNEVSAKIGWGDRAHVLTTFHGRRLDGLRAQHAWIGRDSLLMLGDHVTLDTGTGLVHTAPGHGYDDFVISSQYGLEIYCPVDGRGRFTPDVEHFAGKRVFDANPEIVEFLRDKGLLLADEKYTHSYPHCWRCHKPIIFRATPQWFISMERSKLRERALDAINEVEWIPAWGQDRMSQMFASRPDWCVSRQRVWGVPIIAFYCVKCEDPIADPEVVEHVASVFEKETSDAWFLRTPRELMPPGYVCKKCGGAEFRKENDILDVWFESGSSSIAVLEPSGLPYPADVYLEGGDQFRGWFNSSLLCGLEVKGQPPYRTVVTYGWAIDTSGDKMSKSKGNVISPQHVIAQSGAEILRMWVTSSDHNEDVRISDEIIKRLVDAYRKIRNTARYALGNIHDFDPARDAVPFDEMMEIDRWAIMETNRLTKKVVDAYKEYNFHVAYHSLYKFSSVELSSLYFDILKDRLYTFAPKSTGRRSAQTALLIIIDAMARVLAPILAFTADEIWEHLPVKPLRQPTLRACPSPATPEDEIESVHIAEFPEYDASLDDADLARRWERLFEVRDLVKKELEVAGFGGGSSLSAKVALSAGAELHNLLRDYIKDLPFLFIVSQVELQPELTPELKISVSAAEGTKCSRCWNYTTTVGTCEGFPSLCTRCVGHVREGWGS